MGSPKPGTVGRSARVNFDRRPGDVEDANDTRQFLKRRQPLPLRRDVELTRLGEGENAPVNNKVKARACATADHPELA